jgi:hypothetical protein
VPSKIRQSQGQGEFPQNSFKYSPLEQVRTLYVGFCQGLFSAAPTGSYRWAPALEDTEIVITDESPIHVDTVGKRPALSFTRGPVQSFSLGQDDMLSYDFETGKKKKSILVPGTMSINCCSRNDLESERLAWIIAEQLWLHREMLMKAGFFEIGRQFVVGAPSPAGSIVAGDSADEWVCTTISSPFQFYRTSQITPLGRDILSGINLQFSSLSQTVNPEGPVQGTTGADPPFHVCETAPGMGPGMVPHPLNPAQMVTVRSTRPNAAALRPPAIGGRAIPIQRIVVEQSCEQVTVVTTTKTKV